MSVAGGGVDISILLCTSILTRRFARQSSKLTKTQAADASWFDYEEMTLHQPNVSWMKEEGGKSIQCYIYTKREQVEPVPIENGLGHVHPSVYCEPKAIMCKRESCSGSKDASYVLKADSPGGRLMICN